MPDARQPGDARRAYVDTPIGDTDVATEVATEAARRWGLGRPELLRVGMNAIFGVDDVVLRVGRPSVDASVSLLLAAVVADAGVRVPEPARDDVVDLAGLSVTAWRRLHPEDAPIDWVEVGRMVRTVHELDPGRLPADVPLPRPARFPWWDFDTLLERTGRSLDAAARAGLVETIERHRGWEHGAGRVVCHGDVHPGNVVMVDDGPVLLDWDLLCWAPPGWDHGPMLTWADRWGGRPGAYERFAEGYGRDLSGDPDTIAFAELRLVAATLMRVQAAMTSPDAAAEAQRRLAYWRGDPDAPPWTAQ